MVSADRSHARGERLARRRLVGAALGVPTMAEARQALPRAAEAGAEIVELRLDLFAEPFDLAGLLYARGTLPVIMTLRPADQGGRSDAPAAERFAVLLRAAELGADYVDLEWNAATPERMAALKATGVGVLLSRHDFSRVPADIEGWCAELTNLGADIVKVVGMARDPRDCLPVLRALRRAAHPTVAIAMGAAGLPTRILALREAACFLTFATLDQQTATAPGQVGLADLRAVYRADRLGPRTAIYGLLSEHAEAARAAPYNAWFARAKVDAVAVPFAGGDDAPGIVSAFRDLPVAGWHVHGTALQETVGQALDRLAPSACGEGKVNAISRGGDGQLIGAWVESPEEQFALWTGAEIAAGRVFPSAAGESRGGGIH